MSILIYIWNCGQNSLKLISNLGASKMNVGKAFPTFPIFHASLNSVNLKISLLGRRCNFSQAADRKPLFAKGRAKLFTVELTSKIMGSGCKQRPYMRETMHSALNL